ncbi:MAG: elongation factor Ts [Candidatus Omnitrophica bacterium]|nr:elongation factor Ts [Candidatus Omnitrophota bacterium]
MSIEKIKKLRELTSLGIGECKKALYDAGGDVEKALEILKKRGIELREKKKERTTSQGLVEAYIHFGGNLGSLVEVNCETDFVAHTDVFKKFVKDIAMHIAAADPKYLDKEDIPKEELKVVNNIEEYAKSHCLLQQPFIKDNSLTVGDYLNQVISQTGENIVIRRFVRFSLGEEG